ncbi:MAG: reverse transcriptase domain-containing protein [Verrucomicrobiota bacterium]
MKDRTNRTGRLGHPSTATNPHGGARHGHGSWAEKESRCEGPTLEQVLERENLAQAWQQVRAYKGAPGVDGLSVEEFPRLIRKHWDTIPTKLKAGSYQPSPVKRILIPKPDRSMRAIGIPTVMDCIIQQAIAQILSAYYDKDFSEQSHGFRPGRSAHDAIRQLLNLIGRYLKAGVVLPDGTFEKSPSGVPQGGPLSPLLANIVLDELDQELEARGHSFTRYADDFIILCRSPRAGQRILDSIKKFVQKRLKLVVNGAKSNVVEISHATFLGFQIIRKKIRWSKNSKERFKANVRLITRRTRGVSPTRVIEELSN